LGADGFLDCTFRGGVDLEGLCDTVDGDVDRVSVIGAQGAIVNRSSEEVANCESKALLGCRRLTMEVSGNKAVSEGEHGDEPLLLAGQITSLC
jgi:hypothetical protein